MEVWLLTTNSESGGSSDDDFLPHLIFETQQDVINYSPHIEWSLIDSDVMIGSYPGLGQYYASPWPLLKVRK